MLQNLEPTNPKFHYFCSMIRLFGGLIADIKRKSKFYVSDFRDGLSLQSLASAIFLYFATLTPVVAFGAVLGVHTENNMASLQIILSHHISIYCFLFSIFSRQLWRVYCQLQLSAFYGHSFPVNHWLSWEVPGQCWFSRPLSPPLAGESPFLENKYSTFSFSVFQIYNPSKIYHIQSESSTTLSAGLTSTPTTVRGDRPEKKSTKFWTGWT